jgi:type IV pilus assembly protein PilC
MDVVILNFKYEAVDLEGRKISGSYEALNERELWEELRRRDYFLIAYKKCINNKMNLFKTKVSTKEIADFCNKFYCALNAGINMHTAIKLLQEQSLNSMIKKSLVEIGSCVQKGESLYSSMNRFSNIYPKFMLSMIYLGEQSGKLDNMLKKLYLYYDNEYKNNKKLTTAMIYPITVFITTIIVSAFLLFNVIPTFINTLSLLDTDIPKVTKLIINLSKFLISYKINILFSIMSAAVVLKYLLSLEKGKSIISNVKLKLPLIHEFYSYRIAANICRSMSVLLNSGVNMITSLEITYNIIYNPIIKNRFHICMKQIKMGNSVYSSFKDLKIFDSFVIAMFNVGEQTGNLDDMFVKAAEMYEDMINDKVSKLLALAEPMMILIISIFVGLIILSVIMPMLSVMDSI